MQDETIAHVELSAQQMLMHNDRGDLRPIELQALQALKDVTDGLLFAVHQSTVPDNCFRLVLAKLLFRTNTHSTWSSAEDRQGLPVLSRYGGPARLYRIALQVM